MDVWHSRHTIQPLDTWKLSHSMMMPHCFPLPCCQWNNRGWSSQIQGWGVHSEVIQTSHKRRWSKQYLSKKGGGGGGGRGKEGLSTFTDTTLPTIFSMCFNIAHFRTINFSASFFFFTLPFFSSLFALYFIGRVKRAPHWSVQSRFHLIYVGMSAVSKNA